MLDKLLTRAGDPTAEADLHRQVAEFVESLRDSADRGEPTLVPQAEAVVRADPKSAFTFDAAGRATLAVAEHTWQAGLFAMPTLGELRQRVGTTPPVGTARLWVLEGASPATDIGSLQATASAGSLFQVASQFNCLESPGPYVTSVAHYFSDPTQGPRASISAFPATLLRHYAAPGPIGVRFTQTTGPQQIDLLADVFGPGKSPVRNGYLMGHGGMGAEAFVAALESNFDQIRVGVHDAAQVVLGYNWDGGVQDSATRLVSQVFTSTVAGGGYGGEQFLGAEFEPACRCTLRAAYLGTLLAGLSLRRTPIVLTLIGGGVFHNPIKVIWQAILWAFDQTAPLRSQALDVVLNGYNLSRLIDLDEILPDVRSRGGAILRFDPDGLTEILR